MIRIPKTPNRRSPPQEGTEPTDRDTHQRIFEDENHRRLRVVADAVSDKRDELLVTSSGINVEVQIPNSLGYVPNRMWATDCPFPYAVGRSRSGLADSDWIYVKTNAPAGEKIRLRFDRNKED